MLMMTRFYDGLTQATADARYVINGTNPGAVVITAGGTNQNITLTPTGTGDVVSNGNLLLGTTTDSSNGRLQLANHTTSAGGIGFGTGMSLFSATADTLKLTGGFFQADRATAAADPAFAAKVNNETVSRYIVYADGKIEWGAGGASARDTNLYRSAANTLKTDDALVIGTSGAAIQTVLSATATLDFPNTLAQTDSDLTVTVTGAALGDVVSLGVPHAATQTGSCYTAWVSAADTVTVRFSVYGVTARDPASGTFRVMVHKF